MREFSLIKKNILQYLDFKGVSKYEFYKKTGVSNGVLSQKSGLSEDNVLRLLSHYKDISTDWLLTGIGEMLKDPNANQVQVKLPDSEKQIYLDMIDKKDQQIAELNQKIGRLEHELKHKGAANKDRGTGMPVADAC